MNILRLTQKLNAVLNSKNIFKFIAISLAVFIFLQLPSSVLGAMDVSAVTQSEVDELEDKLDSLNSKKTDLQSEIEALETQQASNIAKKELLDEKVSVTQLQIDATNEQIAQYVQLIEDKKAEIKELEIAEAEQLKLYKERVRTMEENGTVSYYSILFGASSFSDLLSRLDFINEIMKYDEMIYDQLIEAREATEKAKTELEDTKTEYENKKSDLEALKSELDTQISEVSALISQIENNISEYEILVDEAEKEADDTQAEINRKSAELKKQQNTNGGTSSSNYTPVYSGDGTYVWPTASKYVTSPYGTRLHPILGYYRFHSGIDIGGGAGNAVVASAAGTVTIAQYSDSYGNYVVIDHGNSTTLYAHMSSLNVSAGQYVNQGSVVGYVGSTGLSTGAHLHFEISVNGERIDPLSQFDSSTYIRSW